MISQVYVILKKFLLVIVILGLLQWWFKDPSINVPSNDVEFVYIVKYSGGASRNDTLPMLAALHGNGDTAKNFYNTALDQLNLPARIVLLKGPLSYGSGNAWPWSADDFEHYGTATKEAIELLAQKFPTTGKPVLMGFSGGGMMAYYQAAVHGNSYSYVFPISGQLSREQLGDHSYRPGAEVFGYHGTTDNVVSFSGGQNAVNILKENGVSVSFTEFSGGHLGIFTNMKAKITQAIEQKLERL